MNPVDLRSLIAQSSINTSTRTRPSLPISILSKWAIIGVRSTLLIDLSFTPCWMPARAATNNRTNVNLLANCVTSRELQAGTLVMSCVVHHNVSWARLTG